MEVCDKDVYRLTAADPGIGVQHMHRDVLLERFFTATISGNRTQARHLVDQLIESDCAPERILTGLFWPTIQHVEKLYRADQLSQLGHNYATRLIRTLAEQMQLRLDQKERNGHKVLMSCGNQQAEELSALISADLLEANGFNVYFCGGGIANDELVAQIGELQPHVLVVFGAVPETVPQTRILIDRLHDINVCPNLQIVVGGGVFNRADGLAEEIGADLWATDPDELVKVITAEPDRRMAPNQRTVGRKQRAKRSAA